MSEEEKTNETKASVGRPKGSRANRTKRVPLSGHRDLLTVHGKDPNFHYYFVLDTDETGQRIWKFKQAGYEFVETHEIEGVGQERVASDSGQGSVVRIPAGNNSLGGTPQYLYLMKLPIEFYKEDRKALEEANRLREQGSRNEFRGTEGFYGGIDVS